MSRLQTRVEILKFQQKKNNASRVEKKNVSGVERENADQLRCQSMSSLYRDEASIQSGRSLATK